MKTLITLIFVLFVPMLNAAKPSTRRAPRGRAITGTVYEVAPQLQEVRLLRDGKGTLVDFVWIKRTRFMAAARPTDESILKKGAHVKVIYYDPVFGRPFVTLVTLVATPASSSAPR